MTETIEALKKEIIRCLQPMDPEKVILFGSHASGTATEDSDIDLYIVTKDNFIPSTWEEKRKLARRYSRSIQDIRKRRGIDLIVHTRTMSENFIKTNSSFSREIHEKGQQLL
ncbi:nucleotidyltransferase domain-containing protein [Desulfobotulus mexicanus]|uniref:Nucleotidyltransferase domain-containing protein n=1 Tax=Desulfobotulus mexicanus TaxID=2586642 RepID=A0A5Q4VFA5_9BACT|nr:nucleotidyltransferase domain-containing protein [Desulfobotulus mexicanus]TYT74850.1 nucleotidyltransferase domain-containing protein [Desulfobotulus mexicanus]